MPRLLPDPTGHPSPDAAQLIEQIAALADRRYGDSEDHLIGMRDLHHIFTAAVAGWERAAARAVDDPEHAPTLQDMADVTGLTVATVRDRAAAGRIQLPDDERRAAEAKAASRAYGPRAGGGPRRRTAVDRFAEEVAAAGAGAFLVETPGSTGRACWGLVATGEDGPALTGSVFEKVTVAKAVERGDVELGDEQPPPPGLDAGDSLVRSVRTPARA